MTLPKLMSVLVLWGVALATSAALVAAGGRWPQPLVPRGDVVALLVVGPPLLTLLWLLSRWRLSAAGRAAGSAHPGRGESTNCAQGER
jgi:hypothetical protein